MLNLRWGIIAAIFAVVITVGLGLISSVSALHIVLRSIVFMLLFFGLGIGLKMIINSFLPELLVREDEIANKGFFLQADDSQADIVDTSGEYAVPELYKIPGEPDELGNIEDLISGYFKSPKEGIDRNQEEGYNNVGFNQSEPEEEEDTGTIDIFDPFQDISVIEKAPAAKPAFTPSFEDDSGGLGGLPDLDAMAMAFSPMGGGSAFTGFNGGGNTPSGGNSAPASFGAEEPVRSRYVGNKPQQLEGDFNPKELAEGIRTVLKKDR